MRARIYFLIPTILFLACQSAAVLDENPENPPRGGLTKTSSCESLDDDYRNALRTDLEESLDGYKTCWVYYYGEEDMVGTSDDSVTTTNLQETDVDESDIIKSDGDFVYVATDTGADVFSLESGLEKISSINTDLATDSLYLTNNTLILISVQEGFTTITTANVIDPTSPSVHESKTVKGYFISSRLIADTLHLALNHSDTNNSLYPYLPEAYWEEIYSDDCNESTLSTYVDQAYQAATAALDSEEFLFATEGATCDAYTEDDSESAALTHFVSIKLNDSQITSIRESFVSGSIENIYVSENAAYLAHSSYDWAEDEYTTSTRVYRFAFNDETLHSYSGYGEVPGTIDLNSVVGYVQSSFLMDEAGDTLRIATNSGGTSDDSENGVYVLDTTSSPFTIEGRLEGLATGEQIYGARFTADRLYLITFKKTDPLFVIDMSDPSKPALESELEMPGFSTYLHPLDDGHLIGIGRDAQDEGDFAWYQGLKLSLYNVSADPQVTEDILIGSRGSESPVLQDHHGFTYDEESGLMSLPLTLYEGGEGGFDSGEFQYNGVHLYRLSGEDIEEVSEIILPENSSMPLRTIIRTNSDNQELIVLDSDHVYLYDLGTDTLEGSYEL